MPQLDAATFPTQLVWLAITFVALYAILAWIAMPRLGAVLEERQRRIDDDLERATELKDEAEAAMAAYEKAMTEARNGARDIVRQAADALAKRSEERQKELGAKLAQQIQAGEARIAEAKRTALAEVQAIAADVARGVAARLANITVDDGRARAAVKAAADEGG